MNMFFRQYKILPTSAVNNMYNTIVQLSIKSSRKKYTTLEYPAAYITSKIYFNNKNNHCKTSNP